MKNKYSEVFCMTFSGNNWKEIDHNLTDEQLETVQREIGRIVTERRKSMRRLAVIDPCPELTVDIKERLPFRAKLRRFVKRLRREIRRTAARYSDYPTVKI